MRSLLWAVVFKDFQRCVQSGGYGGDQFIVGDWRQILFDMDKELKFGMAQLRDSKRRPYVPAPMPGGTHDLHLNRPSESSHFGRGKLQDAGRENLGVARNREPVPRIVALWPTFRTCHL
jgi:hypothetical protein